ncbi:MAG: DUF3427 domain-containing protein [Coriobacteriales bacterium]|jgi:superfamily II DNA or RNA helicase/HKD family nuclease
MESDVRKEILKGANTAFIDRACNSNLAYRPEFVSNDRSRGNKVLSVLESELAACDRFFFSVAFITLGGVEPLKQTLAELESMGVPGRILTTDYQLFNDPKAMAWLDERPNIEVRMFQTGEISGDVVEGFHTKGYLFHRPDSTYRALIGSSNLTDAALTQNHEWNAKFISTEDGSMILELRSELETLWEQATPLSQILDVYQRIYEQKKQVVSQIAANNDVVPFDVLTLKPNAMQAEFVENMAKLISEGKDKALLISATGTGKTYASAFAMRDENPDKVLFLAHREQILKQAMKSYKRVFGNTRTFGLLSGNAHDVEANYIFATVQTMSRDEVLLQFEPDEFDTIIIDEAHHAAADSYRKIMGYFDASLYLGMTASPDRADGFDIYRMFDNNIACEIRLQDALENNLLCPFHYFGITDIAFSDGDVDEVRDFNKLVDDVRVDYVLDRARYYGWSGDRVKGLVFCSRLDEAKSLSEAFNSRGLNTLVLSGDDSMEQRLDAVDRLSADPGDPLYPDRLDYIFSVDVFNEGIDIPEVNQVIMLRPTESPIIFVQQLGRGLRKADGKDFVVILDFIGNYTNNYMIPLALSGDRSYNKDTIRKYVLEGNRIIPGFSSLHFDKISRERIFESIDKSRTTIRLLREKYQILRNKLGRVPTMLDFIKHGEIDPLLFIRERKSYPEFLEAVEGPGYLSAFSEDEILVLRYLSKFVANGMRPHELLMLQMILDGGTVDEDGFEEVYYSFCGLGDGGESVESGDLNKDFESAKRVLCLDFVNQPSDKKKYGSLELMHIDEQGRVVESIPFEKMLDNPAFRAQVQDIVAFGLERYREKYSRGNGGLTLYEKYSRQDVCRLLDWEKDDSSTVYGYRVKYNTCPIFVTYQKSEDISSTTRYADEFIDQETFSWMTRTGLSLDKVRDGSELDLLLHAKELGLKVYLFIKKSDAEGSDFYYMGTVNLEEPTQRTMEDDNGNVRPVVNFQLKLDNPVRDDYYDYFVKG